MPKLNENYLQLKDSYLFSEIAHRTAAYSEKHPDKPVIRLGIGDVTRPLCECAIKALHESVDEMGQSATFKGYGPEQGYAKQEMPSQLIIKETAWKWMQMRSLFLTEPKVIQETSPSFSVTTM